MPGTRLLTGSVARMEYISCNRRLDRFHSTMRTPLLTVFPRTRWAGQGLHPGLINHKGLLILPGSCYAFIRIGGGIQLFSGQQEVKKT